MTTAIPRILVPLPITSAMLTSSTIAEPDSGETAWVSGGTYAAADICIRTGTHRKYLCILGHTGITTYPENDPIHWKDVGATNRFAMFDARRTTKSTATTSITVVLQPGFFNTIDFFLLEGSTLTISVKDAPSGTVIYSATRDLVGPFFDEYDVYWGPYRSNTTQLLTEILPYPSAELTITLTGATGTTVGIGMCAIGDLVPLIISGGDGGTQYGASAEPVSCSYIKTDDFGDTEIKKRASATNLNLSVVMPQEDADYALSVIQSVLDEPVAVIATDAEGYSGLNVLGLISGPVVYAGPSHATLNANVKGLF